MRNIITSTTVCVSVIIILLLLSGVGSVQATHDEQEILSGEVGTLTVVQPDNETTYSFEFTEEYDDPVVFMKPLVEVDDDPAKIQIQNVTSSGFNYQIKEWGDTLGRHPSTKVTYLVLESGEHKIDGQKIVAGTVTAGSGFRSVSLRDNFNTTPVVVTQTQNKNSTRMVTTKNSVSDENEPIFSTRVVESEKFREGYGVSRFGNRSEEYGQSREVGYVALQPGTGKIRETRFEVGKTPENVGSTHKEISFKQYFESRPHLIADVQTSRSSETTFPSVGEVTPNYATLHVHRDPSFSGSTDISKGESIGYIAIGSEINDLDITATPRFKIRSIEVDEEVEAGTPITVVVSVENVGIIPGESFVTSSVNEFESVENVFEIDRGEKDTFFLQIPTQESDVGNYSVNTTLHGNDKIVTNSVRVTEPITPPSEQMNTTNQTNTTERNESKVNNSTQQSQQSGGINLFKILSFFVIGTVVIGLVVIQIFDWKRLLYRLLQRIG